MLLGWEGEVLRESALSHQFQPGVHGHLPEVMGEQPVPAAAHREVRAAGARQVGNLEVGIPPFWLGQCEEIPCQIGVCRYR